MYALWISLEIDTLIWSLLVYAHFLYIERLVYRSSFFNSTKMYYEKNVDSQ